jgi:hypothetical protein
LKHVSQTIEDALSAAGLIPRNAPERSGTTFDGTAREVDAQDLLAIESADVPPANVDLTTTETPENVDLTTTDTPEPEPGEFLERSFTSAMGTRAYKVYVPAGYSVRSRDPMPMVVMLHGCTQNPDDFAAGTRMNALADEHGFIAVYPAQSTAAECAEVLELVPSERSAAGFRGARIIAGITAEGRLDIPRRPAQDFRCRHVGRRCDGGHRRNGLSRPFTWPWALIRGSFTAQRTTCPRPSERCAPEPARSLLRDPGQSRSLRSSFTETTIELSMRLTARRSSATRSRSRMFDRA